MLKHPSHRVIAVREHKRLDALAERREVRRIMRKRGRRAVHPIAEHFRRLTLCR